MTPIAAYYVMIVADQERTQPKSRNESVVKKPSRLEHIAAALESLVVLGRPSTTQRI